MLVEPLPTSPEPPIEGSLRKLVLELSAERQSLADLLALASDWFWETDSKLRISELSGQFERAMGISPQRWLGRSMNDILAEETGAAPLPILAEMGSRRLFRDLRCAVDAVDGYRHLSLSGTPLVDAAGRFCGYRGTGRDVTSGVEAERRAATLHERFAEAIESVPASLLLCDPEDRIVICNSATRRYFPHVGHLLVPGTRFEDLVRAQAESGQLSEVSGDVNVWVAARMERHRAAQSDMTRQHQDGRWIQIIERRTSDGGIIGIRIDITELKKREQALAEESARATAAAHELKRSNADLEQFAYVASHDLQEPLRMVASYCQLLQLRYDDKLGEDATEYIGFAVEGATRMKRLVKDLLAFSRVGRIGGSFEPLDMNEVVNAAIANLESAIAESGAQIERAVLPWITGERVQLVQLFQNLIGNAIKFRREVPPLIRITASEASGSLAQFTVEDNGIGIEADYVERVFLIFQRLHEREKYSGTGIGLAIAKKVIESHGGHIWIESTPGQGSRFYLTLPTVKEAGESAQNDARPVDQPQYS